MTDRQALTGDVWTFSYDQDRDGSSTATVTDARENDTEYEFDTRGRAKKITDALERERSLQYSSNDNVTDYWSPANSAASSPTSPTTKFSYDTGSGLPGGSETEVGEDSVLTTATTYGGQQSGGGSVSSGSGGEFLPDTTRSVQDTAAPTQSSQDPRGTHYEYDSKGNLQRIERVPDDSVSIAFNYKDAIDAVDGKTGQLEEVIDPRGHSTTLDYWPTARSSRSPRPPTAGPGPR